MKVHLWNEIAVERMNPLVSRQALHSERLTVAKIVLKKGAKVPTHSHENEQLTMMESGRLKFVFPGGELIVEGGQTLQIPPNLPHSAEALEDSVATDLFAPVREDWLRGDDAYLR